MLCKSCNIAVCGICALKEHSKHDVSDLDTVIKDAVDDLNKELTAAKSSFKRIQAKRKFFTEGIRKRQDWQDTIISEIEDATERDIQNLIRQKECLKNEV